MPKTFKVEQEWVDRINKIIERSGFKTDVDFFIHLVQKLELEEAVQEAAGYSPELAKTFSTDVAKLQEAMDAIRSTFLSQMKGLNLKIENEKAALHRIFEAEKEKLQAKVIELTEENGQKQTALQELKAKQVSMEHQLEILQKEVEQSHQLLSEKDKLIVDKEELIRSQQREIESLKNNVVHLTEELSKHTDLKRENESLTEELFHSNLQKKELEEQIKREKERFEIDKSRLLTELDRRLIDEEKRIRKETQKEIEAYRLELKEYQEKLQKERDEKEALRKELVAFYRQKGEALIDED